MVKNNNIFNKKLISIFVVVVMLFLTGAATISSYAVSESDYKATLRIVTDKASVAKDENVTVSLKVKTNYYIFAMEVPIIYDAEAFEMQNTSDTNLKSFLTFQGRLNDAYTTNGNWKSPDSLYVRSNSNSKYWSNEIVKARYKFAFASWACNNSMNNGKAIMLDTEETVVSFVLKAKKDIEDTNNGLVFISEDFKKTASFTAGRLFCGRSVNETIDISVEGYVPVGQTIEFDGIVPEPLPIGCGDNHSYESAVTLPSCTEKGYTTYTCSDCGESYVDNYVDAAGHTESDWITEKEPTYTEEGQRVKKCTVCEEVLKTEVIPTVDVAVCGVVKSAYTGNELDNIILIELYEAGSDKLAYSVTVDGSGDLQYRIGNVKSGSYILKASKLNHVTREYTVTVTDESVICDVQINLIGDVTGDGQITTVDLVRLNAHVRKSSLLTGYNLLCADMTGEGKISTADIVRLNAYMRNRALA